jgi:hypothetical protein
LERKKILQTIYEKVISKNYRTLEDLVKDNCSATQEFYQNLMHELKNDNPMQL